MRQKYNRDLPKNLTYRKKYKKYYWRNPLTGKEFPLNGLSKSQAIAQAIEANNYINNNYTPSALLERVKEQKTMTMGLWLERYALILQRRELSAATYKMRTSQTSAINDGLGNMVLSAITTKHIADFLEKWVVQDKRTMAAGVRAVLKDIFREAIVAGHITINPVAPTRTPKIKINRQRLDVESYEVIRLAANNLAPWFGLAMDLALVTAQRREDLAGMKFSEIYDDRLHVTQIKTGAMLAIPLSLQVSGIRLSTVIDRCRLVSRTDFLISPGIRKNSPEGSIGLDSLTKGFVKARNLAGIDFGENPPTFHEIRSLSGRLFEVEHGKEFVQRLLGHRSEKMTEHYLDTREKDYMII